MRWKQIRLVVILGAISIIGIISIQSYFLFKSWNTHEKQVNQAIIIALKTVAEKISRLNESTLPYGNPVRQLSSNYFVVDVNSTIDANVLEHYLKLELEKHNIRTDYEYAIYDCQTDKMVYGNYISATGSEVKNKLGNSLPKYHEYIYYFGVHFPSLRNTIAFDMALLYFFTSILFLSVVFFAYAIFVILRQKRFSELQRDFFNNMTHEFKTPVSTINIASDVITRPGMIDDPNRLMKYGTIIKQENQRLNMLVDKVLQVAYIEKGKIQLKFEYVNLNELILAIAEGFHLNQSEGAKIETNLSPDVGKIKADMLHLTNIFNNLTENAIKYAGVSVLITIETQKMKEYTRILFSDNGPGIDPKFQKRVFTKFFRVPSGNIHDVKGFGLGLFYVKSVCRLHKWKIQLNQRPDHGATFIIDIPDKT